MTRYGQRRGRSEASTSRQGPPAPGAVGMDVLGSKSVGILPRVGYSAQKRLESVGIRTLKDLLQHFPRRYIDRSRIAPIARLRYGEEATVVATVARIETKRPKPNLSLLVVTVRDGTGEARCVWFNQEFRAKDFEIGQEVAFSGRVDKFRWTVQIQNPSYDVISSGAGPSLEVGRIVPVYPASGRARITSGYLRRLVWDALRMFPELDDPLPRKMLEELGLVDRTTAYRNIHFPENFQQVERARRRLVVDEVFMLQLALRLQRNEAERDRIGIAHPRFPPLVRRFLEHLPFELTEDQRKALDEICDDMASQRPMHRLLQGEVGSGKTVVAAAAMCTAVAGGRQAAFMAPTEVLAGQHYIGLLPYLEQEGVRVALLTSSTPAAERKKLLERVAKGDIDVVIGTHALFQEGVEFADLGLVVVDEQHRFGVHQRIRLKEKAKGRTSPDVLVMTATPIPRTAALTFYGDLDVSTIESLPRGRKPVKTEVVDPANEAAAWEAVRSEVAGGHQAYVVCPVIEESEKLEAAAAEAEFRRLRDGPLAGLRLGLLHGRMSARNREETMRSFRRGDIDVLVSTTIVEVGVDVPNATVMVVLSADRFGISQLHQLRGRVGRGSSPGRCYLLASSTEAASSERLKALERSSSGIELAEVDLVMRGEGAVFGTRQTGRTDLKLTRLVEDASLVARCREWSLRLVERDPLLVDHPELRAEIESTFGDELQVASAS